MQSSLDATWKERGNKKKLMGDNLMEVRAYSYAPPLMCNNARFYRLDTRGFNNTQWLFPREGALRNGKARAMIRNPSKRPVSRGRRHNGAEDVKTNDTEPFELDGQLRLWRKSDPGNLCCLRPRVSSLHYRQRRGPKVLPLFQAYAVRQRGALLY